MLKKILCCLSLTIVSMQAIILGPNMLANSPSEYLLDWESSLQDPEATQQIGNELFERNYIATVTTYDPTVGSFDERPSTPGSGYQANEGQWVWIPDSLGAQTGTWYWILKTKPYYISYLESLLVSF